MSSESKTIGKVVDEFVDTVKEAAKGATKGETLLHSNKAINPTMSKFTGGIEAVGRIVHGEGVGEALTTTFAKELGKDKEGKLIAKQWDVGKIAGSFFGVSAAARIATGGGLYKDKDGNPNIIGVPFV